MILRIDLTGWSVAFTGRSEADLGRTSRPPDPAVAAARERVVAALGVSGVLVGRQVHGADVLVGDQALPGYRASTTHADGVVSSLPALAVGAHVADCLPIALGARGAVGMLHGGWRGLAAGVIQAGVRALREHVVDGELEAVIGPGVGGCCYETGDELRERFAAFEASRGRFLDLKAVAGAQLRAAGVSAVRDVGICTMCSDPALLFSYRRDGPDSGRQGGFAWRT